MHRGKVPRPFDYLLSLFLRARAGRTKIRRLVVNLFNVDVHQLLARLTGATWAGGTNVKSCQQLLRRRSGRRLGLDFNLICAFAGGVCSFVDYLLRALFYLVPGLFGSSATGMRASLVSCLTPLSLWAKPAGARVKAISSMVASFSFISSPSDSRARRLSCKQG